MTTIDWEEIVTTSHFDTVNRIKELLDEEEYEEARYGLEKLKDIMARAERKAVNSQLIRLMWHVLKWKHQPQKRSLSWVRTIRDARSEISDLQQYMPSLNNDFIENIWSQCFERAIIDTKSEMGLSKESKLEIEPLTWQEVFEDEYYLKQND